MRCHARDSFGGCQMSVRYGLLVAAGLSAICMGCTGVHHSANMAEAEVRAAMTIPFTAACAPVSSAPSPVVPDLAGPKPVEHYVSFALGQNPRIQAARMRVQAAAMRVPQAGSLKDPILSVNGWPFFPNTPQTAAGRMTTDVMVSQEVPWRGKRPLRAAAAQAEVREAQAKLAAVEFQTIEEVKLAYFELYYIQRAIDITQYDGTILSDLVVLANSMFSVGRVSQQDVLRLQAERDNVEVELVRLRQAMASSQAELARILGVSPETPLLAVAELPADSVGYDLELLYHQAIAVRPELQAMLAQVQRNRRQIDLARLNYYPDITLRAGWGDITTSRAIAPSANGNDNVAIGLSMNLPLYRDRLTAAVREAESATAAAARDYDELKNATQRDIKRLFTEATAQQELEILFRESILPKTSQALQVAISGYEVGETEFADLIANWRELLRFQLNHLRIQTQLRQSLASLERVVGGLPSQQPDPQADAPDLDMLPSPENAGSLPPL